MLQNLSLASSFCKMPEKMGLVTHRSLSSPAQNMEAVEVDSMLAWPQEPQVSAGRGAVLSKTGDLLTEERGTGKMLGK